ncbi:glycoside hydrolase family 47 protein [Macroventuria anomochaeta]|uniref:Glycoside hydrolase family 47 protein n=1 Tax=Macroventuria anomochaeta TaxID=301207 RepID=A0ACB6RYG3_9PLEO|nr:glycoside hydrolase family 47 protein [Macroventuria anomochaeta]KAF2626455.1 glycoside hydrolase family 47 protein [Macroventuria anomochaeta]
MRRIKIPRNAAGNPKISRQHQRALTYLILGAIALGAYYIWFCAPIDTLAIPFEDHEAYMNDRSSFKSYKSRQSYDWRNAPFRNTMKAYTPLPAGQPRALLKVQFDFLPETKAQRERREIQRVAVRDEFRRSWDSYRAYAWAEDELKPITGIGLKTFGGWGATLVDSLDTLWIMGMKEEFYEGVEAVAAIDFGKSDMKTVSVFETTIRYLGGMLSAYDLSQEPVLLEKAIQLGEMLYRAFDTENHTPTGWLDIEKAKDPEGVSSKPETSICFACLGSLTMEFTRLAQITQQSKYYDAVARITRLLDLTQDTTRIPGLWPTTLNARKEEFNQSRFFSLGALADSTYEYFPKMHALLGGLEPVYQKLYTDSAAKIDEHMLFRPQLQDEELSKSLLFCGDVHSSRPNEVTLDPEMQHLTCFIGGMFGLAGRLFSTPSHIELGEKLTKGCIYAYAAMPTGIAPEIFKTLPCPSRTECKWNETEWQDKVWWHYGSKYATNVEQVAQDKGLPRGWTNIRDKRYLLRPEAIESVFVMYRITGKQEYLDDAWDMFTSIVANTRTPYANGQLLDVTGQTDFGGEHYTVGQRFRGHGPATVKQGNVEDKMESFWTAETLKYFYLVFSRPDMLNLDDWVFNTEAHPFRRPKASKASDVL